MACYPLYRDGQEVGDSAHSLKSIDTGTLIPTTCSCRSPVCTSQMTNNETLYSIAVIMKTHLQYSFMFLYTDIDLVHSKQVYRRAWRH